MGPKKDNTWKELVKTDFDSATSKDTESPQPEPVPVEDMHDKELQPPKPSGDWEEKQYQVGTGSLP